jgi:hypothetical protein
MGSKAREAEEALYRHCSRDTSPEKVGRKSSFDPFSSFSYRRGGNYLRDATTAALLVSRRSLSLRGVMELCDQKWCEVFALEGPCAVYGNTKIKSSHVRGKIGHIFGKSVD